MNNMKILAIAIIVAGALSLSYNTFTYTKDEHKTSIGPIDITTKDREHVVIPPWIGIIAIVIGGVMLISPNRKV